MDRLGVINFALLKAGMPLAAALDDCDWNAGFVFENIAEQALRAHAWGFAQKFAVLARSVEEPAFGFNYAYNLPDDCLKVVDARCAHDLRSPKARYVLRGKRIYTNASPCNCRYIFREYDPGNWPPDFTDAVATRIAAEIIGLSGQRMSLVPQLLQIYQLSLTQAMAADAREETERVPMDDSLFEGRRGEGQQ